MRCILSLVLTIAVATGGCHVSASVEPPSPKNPPQTKTWVRTDLYFGLSKRGGAIISEEQWNTFVDAQVTPRFPDGFTITSAQGHYLQDGRVIIEPSRVITILHKESVDADERINAIVKEYCQRFEQDSVLRSDEPNDVRFLTRQSAQN